MPISHAISKHGKENFTIAPLAECESQTELDRLEVYYVDTLNTWSPNGYNLKAGQGAGQMSAEVKAKISRANKGRKFTKEHRHKLSESHMGQIISKKERRRRSKFMRGKRLPDSAYANAIKTNAKTYHLISPDGKPVTIVNMAKFCRKHGYSKSKMCELMRGKRANYRGWIAVSCDAP